jgi:hypothetical protein
MSAEPRRILFRQPRPEFFNAETNNDAHKLMGKFRYHTDFEIALRPSALKGNAFVYKSTASRAPLRAFVLGKVKAIEIFNVHQEDVSIIGSCVYTKELIL